VRKTARKRIERELLFARYNQAIPEMEERAAMNRRRGAAAVRIQARVRGCRARERVTKMRWFKARPDMVTASPFRLNFIMCICAS